MCLFLILRQQHGFGHSRLCEQGDSTKQGDTRDLGEVAFPPPELRVSSPLSLLQENEILTEQEELLAMEQFLRRQIASEKEEIDRLRAEIAEIQRYGEPRGTKGPAMS